MFPAFLLGLPLLVVFVQASNTTSHLNVTNDSYDPTIAKRYVKYAFASYCDDSCVVSWTCNFCQDTSGFETTKTSYDSATDTYCYIGFNPNHREIVVSFRGTKSSSLQDWIDDLNIAKVDFPMTKYPGAAVHSGFYKAYEAHKSAVVNEVSRLTEQYIGYDVYITGHSLGAAQATLAALDLRDNYGIAVKSYNYGSPRVGNSQFASVYANFVPNNFRVVHNHDLVPHVPPEAFGFHHPSYEVWYTSDTGYRVCNSSGEDNSCSDSAIDLSIPDHLNYLGVPEGCACP